jgi:hypothetical protein
MTIKIIFTYLFLKDNYKDNIYLFKFKILNSFNKITSDFFFLESDI